MNLVGPVRTDVLLGQVGPAEVATLLTSPQVAATFFARANMAPCEGRRRAHLRRARREDHAAYVCVIAAWLDAPGTLRTDEIGGDG